MFDNPTECVLIDGLIFKNLFIDPSIQRFHNSLDFNLRLVDSFQHQEPCQSSSTTNLGTAVTGEQYNFLLPFYHLAPIAYLFLSLERKRLASCLVSCEIKKSYRLQPISFSASESVVPNSLLSDTHVIYMSNLVCFRQ